ncbi:MAG: hypothetical protein GXY67_10665 [Clostridiales bacterium]|nr:hypothetical protein [Clostridiales bacterium]
MSEKIYEIAKALKACSASTFCYGEFCPRYGIYESSSECRESLMDDAAMQLARLDTALYATKKQADSYQEELQALKLERHGMMQDLRHVGNCDICVHSQDAIPGCDQDCADCRHECACKECRNEDHWVWHSPILRGKGHQ